MDGNQRWLVVGSGGREHALYEAIQQSLLVELVLVAPGNGGIPQTHCRDVKESDITGLVQLAIAEGIDYVIVGPEAPLVAGLADAFEAEGLGVVGPSAEASILEASKAFTKELCIKNGIPTASGVAVANLDAALFMISDWDGPLVAKCDGPCGGKGVVVPESFNEAREAVAAMFAGDAPYGEAGKEAIVLEDRLFGDEASIMWLCVDEVAVPLDAARDSKRAEEGDKGLNTGGMGAYSPLPDVDAALMQVVHDQLVVPTLRAMKARGTPFKGILYTGLMLTPEGPKLLEYNVRFGDPETQPLVFRLACDIVPYFVAVAESDPVALKDLGTIAFTDDVAVCVVGVSKGYPGNYEKNKPFVDRGHHLTDTFAFHAGTARNERRALVTSGGRVVGCVGRGRNYNEARTRAYARLELVQYDNKSGRGDIAANL